jgi:hypothetical protein
VAYRYRCTAWLAMRWAGPMPNRKPLLPFGTRLAGGGANYLLWQQDFGDCASGENGSSVPRVCSGEQVMPRDRADRCEVTPSLESADSLSATANSQLHLSECRDPSSASPAELWSGEGGRSGGCRASRTRSTCSASPPTIRISQRVGDEMANTPGAADQRRPTER